MTEATLRDTIEAHAQERGHSLQDLTVMTANTDPYRIDTPAIRRDAEWLSQAWEASGARRPIHLRGLHYALVSTPDLPPRPKGGAYINTDECWAWLGLTASRARWLGVIPFEDIVDERNAAPQIYTQPTGDGYVDVRVDAGRVGLWATESIKAMLPRIEASVEVARQAFRLVLIGEKQSLANVLLPIATRYHAELVLPTGELSITLLYGIVQRAAADGRPCRIFYLSDFDPAGYHMPIDVGRKLQAFVEQFFPLLDVQLRRCALTADQVKALGLPATPLKESERRADRWRERFGVEQTEIDALATLRPRELRQIVVEAVAPYYDATLADRTMQSVEDARQAAEAVLEAVLEDYADQIAEAEVALAQARAAVEAAESIIRPIVDAIVEDTEATVDEIEADVPEPAPDGDVTDALFSSAREWVEQTEILREEKL